MSTTEFVDLFNATYNRKIGPAYYSWRFDREDSNTKFFSVHDGQGLKGCAGLHILGMGEFVVGQVIDAIVAERCRGDGRTFASLNAQIRKCAKTFRAKALFMLPNKHGAHAWDADGEWHTIDTIQTYTRPSCFRPSTRKINAFLNRDIRWWKEIPIEFRQSYPKLAAVQRRHAYLRWRLDNPMHDYTTMSAYKPGSQIPFGYLILKTFLDPQTSKLTGDIVDILWAEDDPIALIEMLYAALDYFHRHGVPEVAMWLQTNTILDTVGRCLGFVPAQQSRKLCVKVLDDEYAWLDDPANWYLTMLDSEIY